MLPLTIFALAASISAAVRCRTNTGLPRQFTVIDWPSATGSMSTSIAASASTPCPGGVDLNGDGMHDLWQNGDVEVSFCAGGTPAVTVCPTKTDATTYCTVETGTGSLDRLMDAARSAQHRVGPRADPPVAVVQAGDVGKGLAAFFQKAFPQADIDFFQRFHAVAHKSGTRYQQTFHTF